MKDIVDNKHREYFAENGWIEFEGLVPQDACAGLSTALKTEMADRLDCDLEKLHLEHPGTLYRSSRDLWRDNNDVQAFVKKKRYGDVAAELTETSPLRLAFDHVFFGTGQIDDAVMMPATESPLPESLHFDEGAYINGIACAMIVCVEAPDTEDEEGDFETPLPVECGSAVFLGPSTSLDLSLFTDFNSGIWLLVAYAKVGSRFVHADDPHAHALKDLGYSSGDRLLDQHHPVISR